MTPSASHSARRERLWRLLFHAALAGFVVLMVVPPQSVPDPMLDSLTDKAHHAISFVVLMVLGVRAYPRVAMSVLAMALIGFGGIMEAVQGATDLGRQASWGDLAADAVGVAIGLVLIAGANYLRRLLSNERHLQ